MKRNAFLLVFFSGHGEFIEQSKEGFFIPQDGLRDDPFQNSYLPYSRLERIINGIPCQHILLAIDACYSGTFDQEIALRGNFKRPNELSEREILLEIAAKYKSRLYLTSGGKVWTPDRSAFASRFLYALRNKGGEDHILDYYELQALMNSVIPEPKAGIWRK